MGVRRRFLNLIVDNDVRGTKSLRCINLDRQKFFDDTPSPARRPNGSGSESEAGLREALKLGRITLPHPSINFEACGSVLQWSIDCFPLGGGRNKVLCADQSGRAFLFDADTRHVVPMPDLNAPKLSPFSVFVPGADADDDGSSLFVMERYPAQETLSVHLSHQFEAFVYRKLTNSWSCQLLPPPPFVTDPKYWHGRPKKISSYGVVGSGGWSICVSVDGAGTYCLDTVKHAWSSAGEWTLPFCGKFEYVPELQLWFGISAEDRRCLTAADLSATDSPPQIVDSWMELETPDEWTEMLDPQLVSLGSGRFCVARFFHTRIRTGDLCEGSVERYFTVVTGVDVVRHVPDGNGSINGHGSASSSDGKGKLGIIKHRSRSHISYGRDGNITAVF
ncbi:hypothetical protein EJB05_11408, partial [Eragrostis curvula]